MTRFSLPRVGLAALVAVLLAGCGWFGGEDEDLDFDDGFAELGIATSRVDESEARPQAASADARLKLNLNVGDRVPLRKTVEQTLMQQLPHGQVFSYSKLRLTLTLSAEEVREGRTRLGVRYDSVQYEHELAGDQVRYDSQNPGGKVPRGARMYQGLVDNGFSFWVGPNNKVIELVGFQDFLERCLRDVAYEDRAAVFAELAAVSGEEEIANFIDDGLSVLPNSEESLRVGDSWTTRRQAGRPLPMFLNNECLLKELTERAAEISIRGTIAPAVNFHAANSAGQDVRVLVRGGHTLGACTIDRRTGLPIHSRVERNIEMVVQTSDGQSFEQVKKVVATLGMSPPSGNSESDFPAPGMSGRERRDLSSYGNPGSGNSRLDHASYDKPGSGGSSYGGSNYGDSNYGGSQYGNSNYGESNYGNSNYGNSNYGNTSYGDSNSGSPADGASGRSEALSRPQSPGSITRASYGD